MANSTKISVNNLSNDELLEISRLRKLPLSEKKKHARELYFSYATAPHISDKLDIKLATLKTWIYGLNSAKSVGWKTEREHSKNEILKELTGNKRGMISNMVNGSIFLLYDFVEKKKLEVIKTGKPITIKEAEKLTGLISNLDRIVQNAKSEDGGEEDGTFTKPTSVKEMKSRIETADPFSGAIETTAKEVIDESNKKPVDDSIDDDDVIISDSDM